MLKELLEKRARIFNQMKDLQSRAKKESRAMGDDEQKSWDAMNADYDALTKQINTEQRMLELDKIQSPEGEKRVVYPGDKKPEPKKSKEEIAEKRAKAFDTYMRHGAAQLDAEERSILKSAEYRGTNTQIASTNTLGGYTVPIQFSNDLDKAMLYYGGIVEAARSLRTSIGGTLNYPTLDDTGTSSNWVSEGGALTVQDMTFGNVAYGDYTLATLVKFSVQMLNDEGVNLQSELVNLLAERHWRELNASLTTGDGSGKPTGVVDAATASGISSASISRGDLIDLIHSVDRAYRNAGNPKCGFMFNDATLAAIKKLSIGSADDRPLWQPSMRVGEPDRIEGFSYYVNNDMADIGAANKSILFGDFSKYIKREVSQGGLVRLNERYMDSLSVGFIYWGRYDGKILNNKAIKSYVGV